MRAAAIINDCVERIDRNNSSGGFRSCRIVDPKQPPSGVWRHRVGRGIAVDDHQNIAITRCRQCLKHIGLYLRIDTLKHSASRLS